MSDLKPCKCGNAVDVKYICGFGGGLKKIVKNPFAGSMPAYYILCCECGENMYIRLNRMDVKHRDKCKRDLIKAWNRRVSNE